MDIFIILSPSCDKILCEGVLMHKLLEAALGFIPRVKLLDKLYTFSSSVDVKLL